MTICKKLRAFFVDYYRKMFVTEFRILVLGLNGSSKSSTISQVFDSTKEVSNKEVIELEHVTDGVKFIIYDLKGDRKYRRKWDYFYRKCDVLIYCVDLSATQEVWDESTYELQQLLGRNSRKMKNMLVLGTKNDKGRAKDISEMILQLGLRSFLDIEVACFSVSARENTNIDLVKPWLYEQYQIKHMKARLNLF